MITRDWEGGGWKKSGWLWSVHAVCVYENTMLNIFPKLVLHQDCVHFVPPAVPIITWTSSPCVSPAHVFLLMLSARCFGETSGENFALHPVSQVARGRFTPSPHSKDIWHCQECTKLETRAASSPVPSLYSPSASPHIPLHSLLLSRKTGWPERQVHLQRGVPPFLLYLWSSWN